MSRRRLIKIKKLGKRKPKRFKKKLTPEEKSWRFLRVLKSGANPNLTVDHPKAIKAAQIVGVGRAIRFLSRPMGSKDLMVRGRRMPGSFQSRT